MIPQRVTNGPVSENALAFRPHALDGQDVAHQLAYVLSSSQELQQNDPSAVAEPSRGILDLALVEGDPNV
jgi:hypothetical protein